MHCVATVRMELHAETSVEGEESMWGGVWDVTGVGEHIAHNACLICEQSICIHGDAHVVAIIASSP